LVSAQRLFVATTQQMADDIATDLPELPQKAIIVEPCKRDTAPCIGLAALHVSISDPDATMAVMPADHVILRDEVFRQAIRLGAALVDEQPERLVTFGIRPTYPAESFGYIQRGERLPVRSSQNVSGEAAPVPAYSVKQFREKPDADTARQYMASGEFYWNSGIFVWKARRVLDLLERYQPEMHDHLKRIGQAIDTPEYDEVLHREFAAIRGTSIDYAVMEQAPEVVVLEAPFDWDDLGSWQALARLRGADEHGNTVAAKHLAIETTGTIVRGEDDHLIVTVGLDDCIIVHTSDATLVARKQHEESIRKVVELLKQQKWNQYV
jgi:mannose-1-phosphate guanylyltransferase